MGLSETILRNRPPSLDRELFAEALGALLCVVLVLFVAPYCMMRGCRRSTNVSRCTVRAERVRKGARLPSRALSFPGAIGHHLFASESVVVPIGVARISTGVRLLVPPGYVAHLSTPLGGELHVLASLILPGVLDEVVPTVVNTHAEEHTVRAGDAIASIVLLAAPAAMHVVDARLEDALVGLAWPSFRPHAVAAKGVAAWRWVATRAHRTTGVLRTWFSQTSDPMQWPSDERKRR
jgi:dUTPase